MIEPWQIYSEKGRSDFPAPPYRTFLPTAFLPTAFLGFRVFPVLGVFLILGILPGISGCFLRPDPGPDPSRPPAAHQGERPSQPSLAARLQFPPVLITVPRNILPDWRKIRGQNPLPSACSLALTNRQVPPSLENRSLHLELFTRSWRIQPPSGIPSSPAPLPLQTRYYAPAVPLHSSVEEITSTQILSGNLPAGTEILPLHAIRLPLRAVPVDSLLPGEPGYMLQEEICLSLRYPPEPGRIPRSVQDWIAGFYGSPEPPRQRRLVLTGGLEARQALQDRLILNQAPLPLVFRDILPILQGADLSAGSLYGCVTSRSRRYTGGPPLRADQRILPLLRKAGFQYLSTLSRDSLLYGTGGFQDHLGYLKRYGLTTGGTQAGQDSPSPESQDSLLPENCTFAFPQLTFRVTSRLYPADWTERSLLSQFSSGDPIRVLPAGSAPPLPGTGASAFTIVFLQTSRPLTPPFSPALRRVFRQTAEQADLVVGSWPGPPGGMELHQGTPMVYNLGTLLGRGTPSAAAGFPLLLEVIFLEGRPLYWNFFSLRGGSREVSLDPGRRGARYFRRHSTAGQREGAP